MEGLVDGCPGRSVPVHVVEGYKVSIDIATTHRRWTGVNIVSVILTSPEFATFSSAQVFCLALIFTRLSIFSIFHSFISIIILALFPRQSIHYATHPPIQPIHPFNPPTHSIHPPIQSIHPFNPSTHSTHPPIQPIHPFNPPISIAIFFIRQPKPYIANTFSRFKGESKLFD